MSITINDKIIDILQLNEEISLLNLTDFIGVAQLSRDSDGNIVTPYILIKVGILTSKEETDLRQIVDDHIPAIKTPTERDNLIVKLTDNTMTFDELKQLERIERGL